MARSYLGLGANLGQPAVQIEAALKRIAALPDTSLISRSALYRSEPLGPAGQPDYCNAVGVIETRLTPVQLLDALQAIEDAAGRRRDGIRWDARTLDIDILHIESVASTTPRLTLPHPQIAARNFVLVPLAAVAPMLVIPGLGSVHELAARLGDAGLQAWA